MEDIIRCSRCIMDNSSDKTIVFDKFGYCNYCTNALARKQKEYFPNEVGQKKLEDMLALLKAEGKNKKYDCIMGISGGLDSAYLAYLGAVKWGLLILAVHIDDGFDTDLAVSNIKNLVDKAQIDLITITPDEEQFCDLTRAFIYAEVPDIAIPQDNVLFAALYKYARKNKIRFFLSGSNFALESILQASDVHDAYDVCHIKDINKKFGKTNLKKLPLISWFQCLIDRKLFKLQTLRPLNFIDYNKEKALEELNKFSGFTYYEAKHLENRLTKVIQLVWFKQKCGVDKRTSHLSSLIVSDQLTREEALAEYQKPLCNSEQMDKDIDFVLNKLKITRSEFTDLLNRPYKPHTNYQTSFWLNVYKDTNRFKILRKIVRFFK